MDQGEPVTFCEPTMPSESASSRLSDLAVELVEQAATFESALPLGVAQPLADLVRSMNCYYSNLIEGHNTHPVDIERALQTQFSDDPHQRDLQLEAKAHIAVQSWIDAGGIAPGQATHPDVLAEIHRRFYDEMPAGLATVDDLKTGRTFTISPGGFRDGFVQVGRHIAISPGAVPRFLNRLHERYQLTSRIERIIAIACAHHRLLWVHPFPDGNGRVVRLVSHAMLSDEVTTRGLWSVARGLARQDALYKQHLINCDAPRQGDLDGRGQLSEKALVDFAAFFLTTCLDQVRFMRQLTQPAELAGRIHDWAAKETAQGCLPQHASTVMDAVLLRGNLNRAELAPLLGVTDRQARRVSSALVNTGALRADSNRSPLCMGLPAHLAGAWLPGLFPEKV